MRRALILIIVLMTISVSVSLFVDNAQRSAAKEYLQAFQGVRNALSEGDTEGAACAEAYLHAKWQQDSRWLNCIISHHHTRAVGTAMLELSTALRYGWEDEIVRALDKIEDALGDIENGDYAKWENIL